LSSDFNWLSQTIHENLIAHRESAMNLNLVRKTIIQTPDTSVPRIRYFGTFVSL
jgi:hypothetical protein